MEKGGGGGYIVEEDQLSVQAGVPRREQCLVCGKPIFLAERMRVGDRFYHRRCLKCARCQTQLTLGSFYETEVDGQFCCETCPDEEVRQQESDSEEEEEEDRRLATERQQRLAAEEEKRISSLISNRLAMFERKPIAESGDGGTQPNWRNSSLSDEQKSKSMKNFLKISGGGDEEMGESPPPPPLPSYGPPRGGLKDSPNVGEEKLGIEKEEKIVPERNEEENVILRKEKPEESKNIVRESQSVSNIREMFEKKGLKKSPERIAERKNSIEEVKIEMKEEERKNRTESTSTEFFTPMPVPRMRFDGGERESPLRSTQLEFKTPRKPSVEEWKDVKMAKDEEEEMTTVIKDQSTGSTKGLSEDDEVFLSPRGGGGGGRKEEENAIEGGNSDDQRDDDKTETRSLELSGADEQPGEMKQQVEITVPENNNEQPELVEEEASGKVAKEGEQEQETNEESSATKESDQIKEPSLELKSEANVEEKEKAGAVVDGEHKNRNEIAAQGEGETVEVPLKEVERVEDEHNYPLDLNPFGSDDEEEAEKSATSGRSYNPNLNPFGEEEEEEKIKVVYRKAPEKKRISTNPFGSEEEDEEEQRGGRKVTPVPTPRRTVISQRPEPSPRFQLRVPAASSSSGREYYGSVSSLSKSSDFRGSTNSLSSTCSSANTSGTYQRHQKKRRAPLPPGMMREANSAEYLTVASLPRKSSDASLVSDKSTEQKSTSNSPRTTRKKRPAPKPPGPVGGASPSAVVMKQEETQNSSNSNETLKSPPSFEQLDRELHHSTPLKVNESSEKTKSFTGDGSEKMSEILDNSTNATVANLPDVSGRRVIPVDDQLLEDQMEEMLEVTTVTTTGNEMPDDSAYLRRMIVPLAEDESPMKSDSQKEEEIRPASRQWEKMKQNKESENRNRQSLVSNSSDGGGGGGGELDRFYNKSQQGKWKRRKGPAPALPVPPKRVLQMLPIQDIKHELEVIEVQQQGLEKQGVQLEKMIREKTEGPESLDGNRVAECLDNSLTATNRNTKEVEDLIMQLFDLVVEKNELFRRQAELMYLRRQHRLEAEQADLEYEIRVLMAQPECNKTDSDKAKEETMIARLMEVVKQRNEVVDCLEMDRLREAQEDLGIKQEIEKHTAKWDEEFSVTNQKPVKLSKKEKKTLKEEKKKLKNKKLDVDKDYDETETTSDKSMSGTGGGGTLEKVKKKKKKFLIL